MIKCLILLFICLSNIFPEIEAFIKTELKIKKEWLRPNPVFKRSTASFFNLKNANQLMVFPVDVLSNSKLCVTDCENKFFKQFKNIESLKLSMLKDKREESLSYVELELIPSNKPEIIMLANNKIIKSKILSWHKGGINECPGNHSFPSLTIDANEFDKKIRDSRSYFIFGMISSRIKESSEIKTVIGIYSPRLNTIKEGIAPALPDEYQLETVSGQLINGFTLDLNNDRKVDIFWFMELIDSETEYFRLYLNIEGKWCCKWIELIEGCV